MSLIVSGEYEFESWFKKNLDKFGYIKRLVEPKGIYQSPFPDYWCVKEDMKVERVELEALSYNFHLHRHDLTEVDRVISVENNHWLYGSDLPDKFTIIGGIVISKSYQPAGRSLYEAVAKLVTPPKKKLPAVFLSLLRWRMPPDCYDCFYCGKSIDYTSSSYSEHSTCIEKVKLWIRQLIVTNFDLLSECFPKEKLAEVCQK